MRHWPLLLLFASLFAPLGHAQEITSVSGDVSMRPSDNVPWFLAAAGVTISPGTSFSLGPKAWVDIRLDSSNSFQAAANSQFQYNGVENDRYQIQLTGGKLTCQAADLSVGSLRVNLTAVGVESAQPGIYVIQHAAGGQSQVTVEAGLARVVAPNGSELVNAGEKMQIRYTAGGPEFRRVSAVSRWRRFLSTAASVVQLAANISASADVSSANNDSARKAALPAKSASHPVDTRQRSDPPAKSGPPSPTPLPSKSK